MGGLMHGKCKLDVFMYSFLLILTDIPLHLLVSIPPQQPGVIHCSDDTQSLYHKMQQYLQ